MTTVAVFDIGKTNVKLSAVTQDGEILEMLSTPNVVLDEPPYRHHDLTALETWLVDSLRRLARGHPIDAVVTSAHGSGGVLTGVDGPAMPMMDYEQQVPEYVDRIYRSAVGNYRERGSGIMLGAAHLARQMLWQQMYWPHEFSRASAFLATPQYWAWRLCGVAASEITSLAAQSHLWTPADRRPAKIVADRGWQHLVPPMRRAWETLGSIRPELAASTSLSPQTRVLCGVHDSSANFYRYQAAGLSDMTVVSTGTWIVLLTDRTGVDFDKERPGHACNADVFGHPMPGMLTMGGREFAAVAGSTTGPASAEALARIVSSGTLALPTFGPDDGLFPGTAMSGRIDGELAEDPSARFTLAALYAALLTAECVGDLPRAETVILDGNFVAEPLYGPLVAALLPETRVLVSSNFNGTATGAALLAGHETRREPARLSAAVCDASGLPDLSSYRERWRSRARSKEYSRDLV